ncbi:hypothetical protein [Corynebacterium sp. 335C]
MPKSGRGGGSRGPRRSRFTTRRVQGGDRLPEGQPDSAGRRRDDAPRGGAAPNGGGSPGTGAAPRPVAPDPAAEPEPSRVAMSHRLGDDSRATAAHMVAHARSTRAAGDAGGAHGASPLLGPAQSTDERVDDLDLGETSARGRLTERLGPALDYARKVASFLFTSPGRLTAVAVVLVVAILAAGLSMSQTTADRQQRLAELSATAEPLSHAAQNLYSSLSIADATANTAFSRGILNAGDDLRGEYDDAIARASLAGTRAATGITDVDSAEMRDIAEVQRMLPIYTGLIESARTHSRLGNPVGSTYLAEASDLMSGSILPHAAGLYYDTSDMVAEERARLTRLPWVPLSGLAAAILLLVLAQWMLARRTGRLVNNGLALATLLTVVAFVAVGAVTLVSWRGPDAYGGARSPVQLLTQARITAQQTRAAETLDLVHRRPGGDDAFAGSTAEVRDLLADASEITAQDGDDDGDRVLADANRALVQWQRSHAMMQRHIDEGNYELAVDVATGPPNQQVSSVREFDRLDSSLQSSIDSARHDLRVRLEDARAASQILAGFVTFLTILAAICVALGFRHPLMEYL